MVKENTHMFKHCSGLKNSDSSKFRQEVWKNQELNLSLVETGTQPKYEANLISSEGLAFQAEN